MSNSSELDAVTFLQGVVTRLAEGDDPVAFVGHAVGELVRHLGADHAFLIRYHPADHTLCLHLTHDGTEARWGPSGNELALFAAPFPADITPAFRLVCRARRMVTPTLFAAVLGDEVTPEEFAWPGGFEYMTRAGVSDSAVTVLFAGDEPLGTLNVQFTGGRRVRLEDEGTFLALARLVAVALRLGDRAAESRDAAIAREREVAAELRASELAKANDAMRGSLQRLAQGAGLDALLEGLLLEAMRVAGASGGGLTRWRNGRFDRLHCVAQDGAVVPPAVWSSEAIFREAADVLGRDAGGFATELLSAPVSRAGVADMPSWWPAAADYHARRGHVEVWNVPCAARGELLASLGLAFREPRPMDDATVGTLTALAQQMTLALELTRLAEEAQAVAVAREREAAAEQRATQLARANASLYRSLSALSKSADFDDTLDSIFAEIVATAQASTGQLLQYDPAAKTLATTIWIDETGRGRGVCPDSPPLLLAAFDADITPAFRACVDAREIFVVQLDQITPEEATMSWPGTIDWHRSRGRQCACAIPILIGRRPLGMIGLAWTHVISFTPEQRELLFALTSQAALVMQLKELANADKLAAIARERESAAEQRAAELAKANAGLGVRSRLLSVVAEVSTLLARSDDFRAALDATLRRIGETAGLSRVVVFEERTNEPGESVHFVVAEWCAAGVLTHAECGTDVIPSLAAGEVLAALRRGTPVWRTVEEFPEPLRGLFRAMRIEASGCVPLLLDGIYVGTLAFDDCTGPRPWEEAQVDALTAAANAIAGAMQNRRAAERRVADLAETNTALKQTLDAVVSEPELDKVLGHVLVAITQHLRSPSSAVWLLDAASGRFAAHLAYHEGRVVEVNNDVENRLNGAWGRGRDLHLKDHIRLRKPVVYQVEGLATVDRRAHDFFRRHGVHTLLGIPLLLGEEIVGSLTVRFDTARNLRAEDLELSQAIAHQATMAVQLTRLAERAGQAAVLGERTRLAREIHDTVAQGLVAILMHTRAAASGDDPAHHLAVTQRLAEENLAEARRAVRALRPTVAGSDGVEGSLRRLALRLSEPAGPSISVRTRGQLPEVSPGVEDELGRIAREAAANAVKHSGADEVVIELVADGTGLSLTVSDDGRGFDSDRLPAGRYGVVGMIERAERIGAELTIISEPGRGTTVVVAWQPGRSPKGGS